MDFQSLLKNLDSLDFAQLKQLKHHVDARVSNDRVGQVVAHREEDVSSCPHCTSEELMRWGRTKQGIQRFKCKSCSKTFNALAGTPLHRMRKPDKWVKYTEMMWDGVSLRKSAKELNINLRTAFRWRHAFLAFPTNHNISEIAGVIEADETFVKESFKGSRNMPRKSRQRGKRRDKYPRGELPKQIPVAIAINRSGDIAERVMERNTTAEIQAFLHPILAKGSVLCSDGKNAYMQIAKGSEVEHKKIIEMDGEYVVDGIYHIQTINNYMMNWKNWMFRFRGVATKYLPNYLGWYRFMCQHEQTDQEWIKSSV